MGPGICNRLMGCSLLLQLTIQRIYCSYSPSDQGELPSLHMAASSLRNLSFIEASLACSCSHVCGQRGSFAFMSLCSRHSASLKGALQALSPFGLAAVLCVYALVRASASFRQGRQRCRTAGLDQILSYCSISSWLGFCVHRLRRAFLPVYHVRVIGMASGGRSTTSDMPAVAPPKGAFCCKQRLCVDAACYLQPDALESLACCLSGERTG